MIPSTSVLLLATVALNAITGLAAPIKVKRADAEAHRVGRRHPQPIAADDLLKARSPEPAPAPAVVDPAPVVNRRFPRRAAYERYARQNDKADGPVVAARAPEPVESAVPVAARSPGKPEQQVHRRHHGKSSQHRRSTTSNSNVVKKRNSKHGGTLSKKRALVEPKPVAKRSEEVKAPSKRKVNKRSPRSPSKKRSPKARTTVAKKRNAKRSIIAKDEPVKRGLTVRKVQDTHKRNLILPGKKERRSTKAASTKRSNNKKRSTSNNKKRSNKNIKKRDTVVKTPDVRALDVPSKNLLSRDWKLIKIGSKHKSGCSKSLPIDVIPVDVIDVETPCSSCCSCACGCQNGSNGSNGQQTPPVIPPVTGGEVPPVIPPVGSPSGSGTVTKPTGTVTDPTVGAGAGAGAGASSSSAAPVATGVTTYPADKSTTGGAVVPPVVPPVVASATPTDVAGAGAGTTTKPKAVKRSFKKVARSPRISGAGPQRRSSRNRR